MPNMKPDPGEASYALLARVLTVLYPNRPPVTRQTIRNWNERHTLNKDGKPFPAPHRVNENASQGQARMLWLAASVIEWAEPGVPDEHGKGWRE